MEWVASSRDDLKRCPVEVQGHVGYALYLAQIGSMHRDAKPLHGLGAGVYEIVSRVERGSYRTVHLVAFAEAVYVLHVFQKKATKGISTPRREIDVVRRRLASAFDHHFATYGRRS